MADNKQLTPSQKPSLLTPNIGTIPLSNTKEFETLPSSPILHLTNQAINSFGANRPIKANKNTKINYIDGIDDQWSITSENKTSKLTLTIDNVGLLKSSNKGLKKCFAFILVQCNDQHYKSEIGFPLQALVDNGMYANIKTARKGIKDSIERIMSLTFKGTSKKGKNVLEEQGGKLIYHYDIKNSYVVLSFNEKLNIEFIAQYFTMLPKFSFGLSNRAFSLVEYIFYLARQNTRAIKEKGSFNISFRAIQDYLNLPSEADTKDHTKLIRNPIEEAIEEVETANNNSSFTMTPIYNEGCKNIREWLDGYIQIGLKKEFADTFIKIAEDTEKQVEASLKRKEKAITMVEAKKIEAAAKKSVNK